MPEILQQQLSINQDYVSWLYQKYSALLLGYLVGAVQSRQTAERYLITIISRFVVVYEDESRAREVTWVKLLKFTRHLVAELQSADYANRKIDEVTILQHKQEANLGLLTSEEKEVFCAIYYQGKSIGQLANHMQQSESSVRCLFKISFDKIRSARGN